MKSTQRRNHLAAAIVGVLASSFSTPLVAQSATNAATIAKPSDTLERPDYRPWMVGLGVGTDGLIGAGVSWRFSDHLGMRTGVAYAEASRNDVGIAGLEYNARLRLLDEPLTLDVYPWQTHSFHISLGLLLNQNELSGTVSSTGTITVNGQPVVIPEGSLTVKIKQQPVNPYLSIGGNLFYFDRAHCWGLAGELGVAYTGSSRVSLDRSAGSSISDDAVSHVQNRLEKYADQYQWWPVAKLAVTFSF